MYIYTFVHIHTIIHILCKTICKINIEIPYRATRIFHNIYFEKNSERKNK